MSRHDTRGKEEDGCWECGGAKANAYGFRRSSSLRLRGERPTYPHQRLSANGSGACPSITEHPRSARQDVRPLRQRSFSLNTSSTAALRCTKSNRTCPNSLMEGHSEMDAATPPGSPEDLPDDDSLHSCSSAVTANSMDANYAAYNGTTFSGRSMRYVLHCSTHAGLSGDEYLTPTQRAQKQIRRLKSLLLLARQDLEKKDSEIFQLTKEVVELRLYKASLCSPDDKSNSSEMVTIRENGEDGEGNDYDEPDAAYKQTPTRSHNNDMQSSFTDSGHFEDLTNSSLHSKDSQAMPSVDLVEYESDRRKLIEFYEKKMEEMMRSHSDETQELKKQHNDKIEALLQRLADVNTRYGSLLPDYEAARERIHSLEKQLEDLSKQLADEEAKHRSAYLTMYNKGLEAAKYENADKELGESSTNRVSVSQLLEQLQITQTELDNVRAMYRRIMEAQSGRGAVDAETTLQFLKSAVYYFLTDPDNHQGHLKVIESILGYSDKEKTEIRKRVT